MKFEQFYVGQKFQTPQHVVSEQEIREFATRYDAQLMHLDRDVARAGPFGDIIAPGHLSLAIAWGLFVEANILGADSRGGLGLDEVRWMAPVYPGDTVSAEVEISQARKTSKGDRGVVVLDFTLRNQQGKDLLKFKSITLVACAEGPPG